MAKLGSRSGNPSYPRAVSITISSTSQLAAEVTAALKSPVSASITGVPEFAGTTVVPCDSTDLLHWIGWMTAGPPSLAADVLRSAGRWALIRYRWALEDRAGIIRPTPDARSIKQHTRSTFSEAVGIGAAGYLGCREVVPPVGSIAVVNLDDAIDLLLRRGILRKPRGYGRKQPDYIIATGLGGSGLELLAVESKGTVKTKAVAIGQLAAGVHQVLGIESDLPMRRIVFATTLDLDAEAPEVRCHAIEVKPAAGSPGEPDLLAAEEAILDAALIRSLRCAGRYDIAQQVRLGSQERWFDVQANSEIAGRPMAGNRAELAAEGALLVAELGIDIDVLRALGEPGAERRELVERTIRSISEQREGYRERTEGAGELRQETLMRDGVGIRFEIRQPRGIENRRL